MTPGREPSGHHARASALWRRHARYVGTASVVLAVVVGVAGVSSGGASGRARTHSAHKDKRPRAAQHRAHRATVTGVRTFLGATGVESSAIIAENRRPGTTAWRITGAAANGSIDGFANENYAAVGQQVVLYVSTSAPTFRVVAYRMGWYQGKGARQVWSSQEVAGVVQPPCPLTPGVNMVSCDNWSSSLAVPITSNFVQGDYLFKLVGSGGQQAYIPLTVWDPDSTAAYLFVNRSLTEEGWNTYGGYSYYQGLGPCTLGQKVSYPPCNRARIVSFDRPYAQGNGASDFLGNEYPLLQFMEEHGLDVAYVTDVTIDEHPSIVLNHRALLSLGHDETWTYTEREAADIALAGGVNVVFFGAAAVLRHSRLQASPLGPDREEVNYRDPTEDPVNGSGDPMEVTGNTWSAPPTDLSPSGITGEEYSGYLNPGAQPVPFVVDDASAWIFKGTGLKDGSSVPGVIDSDIDHVDPSFSPGSLQVLGHSPVPLSEAYTNQGKWNGVTYSDMTYYTDPTSDAGVIDTGTVNWIYALSPCPASATSCPSAAIGAMTANLLWLFGQGPAGAMEPSVPNRQAVTPPGS